LLAATLYQGNRDRNHKLWNIASTERKLKSSLLLEFLIDNMDTIFVIFGGRVFQQTVGMHMGTRCTPLLADLFRHQLREN
jgi:hypothetical protein